ncbi:MAG: 30S ribosome-binding factor RbfA [Candidatus Margulisbacteria bacterium]|nr:30S ribosome-binding factor RbfA [Candidatus Margulisiibacteriota bacterium]
MSIRTQKVADLIRDELSLIFQRKLNNKQLGLISITEVEVTSDFAEAFVYLSIFGNSQVKEKSLNIIKNAAGFIRGELGRKINLRITPKLIFREDNSLERGSKIIEKLKALEKKQKNKP